MRHDKWDTLKDYWSTLQQFYMPFYSNMNDETGLIFSYIRISTHFCINDKNYGRIWKIRSLFNMLYDTYAEFYSPSDHLAVDEVIVLLKGGVVLK
jgi:hypothetical protein